MTPLRQVMHVLWKDLREQRVRVAAFVVVVAAAALRAAGTPVPVPGVILAILVFLTGVAIVGAPVLADSPSNPRAAWAARPLAPDAVLGAKLAFAILLVLTAAVAQALALATFGLSPAAMWPYVVTPVAWFGAVLLAALVVAAATNNERSHLLLVLALVLGMSAIGQLLVWWRVPTWTNTVARWVVPVLMLGALGYFFRSRRGGLPAMALGFVVVSLGAAALVRKPLDVLDYSVRRPDLPRVDLQFSIPEEARMVREGVVRIRLGAMHSPRGWQYSLRNPVVFVTLASGRKIALEPDANLVNLGGDPGPVPVPGEVLGSLRQVNTSPTWRDLKVSLFRKDLDAEGAAIVQATLTGDVLVTAMGPVDTIPLRLGAVRLWNGIRSRIDSLTTVGGRPEIRLHAEGITSANDRPHVAAFTSYFGRSYALLGSDGGAPVPLQQTWAASEPQGLVLPTTGFGEADLHLELFPAPVMAGAPRPPEPSLDEGWLRTARLLAIEPVPQGSYRVSLEWKLGG